jgi:hypothetical protein
MNLKQMLDDQERIVKTMLLGMKELQPMVVVFKGNTALPIIVAGGREDIRRALDCASSLCPDYLVTITEAYMEKIDKKNKTKEEIEEMLNNHVVGSLERRFSDGDKSVVEIIAISVYSPEGKLARTLLKENLEQIEEDCENFAGFLTINDVDRVFWGIKR